MCGSSSWLDSATAVPAVSEEYPDTGTAQAVQETEPPVTDQSLLPAVPCEGCHQSSTFPGETAGDTAILNPFLQCPSYNGLSFPIPVTDADVENVYESSHAVLIAGRDDSDCAFEQACLNDVNAIENCLSGTLIPPQNVKRIVRNENSSDVKIEEIFSSIILKNPRLLLFCYSGHGDKDGDRLRVSEGEGNALNVWRIRKFISSLSDSCKVWVMLDSCSAGSYLLLPVWPAAFRVRREHMQLFSCSEGGTSYKYPGSHSPFTRCFLSALIGATKCPNRTRNCQQCSKFRSLLLNDNTFSPENFTVFAREHLQCQKLISADCDLPQVTVNPVDNSPVINFPFPDP